MLVRKNDLLSELVVMILVNLIFEGAYIIDTRFLDGCVSLGGSVILHLTFLTFSTIVVFTCQYLNLTESIFRNQAAA